MFCFVGARKLHLSLATGLSGAPPYVLFGHSILALPMTTVKDGGCRTLPQTPNPPICVETSVPWVSKPPGWRGAGSAVPSGDSPDESFCGCLLIRGPFRDENNSEGSRPKCCGSKHEAEGRGMKSKATAWPSVRAKICFSGDARGGYRVSPRAFSSFPPSKPNRWPHPSSVFRSAVNVDKLGV